MSKIAYAERMIAKLEQRLFEADKLRDDLRKQLAACQRELTERDRTIKELVEYGCFIKTDDIDACPIARKNVALCSELAEKDKEIERLKNLLEDVVNALDLSDKTIGLHGPLGTEPAELVRIVLAEKDLKIRALQNGLKEVNP
jgi:uncharacterized coiled-coil protein SlyX